MGYREGNQKTFNKKALYMVNSWLQLIFYGCKQEFLRFFS